MKLLLLGIAALVLFYLGMRLAIAQLSELPAQHLGQPLAACPETPNCVSSLANESRQRIEPLRLTADTALAEIADRIARWPGARIETLTDNYLHATFRSRLWGFIDDVEIASAADAGDFHVRSASRLGYSDLGANRRRLEALRASLLR